MTPFLHEYFSSLSKPDQACRLQASDDPDRQYYPFGNPSLDESITKKFDVLAEHHASSIPFAAPTYDEGYPPVPALIEAIALNELVAVRDELGTYTLVVIGRDKLALIL